MALPRFLFAINGEDEGWQPRCGITKPRHRAPVLATRADRRIDSVRKRCSVDCGVPQRRCKSTVSLRGNLPRSTGALL